MPKLKSDPDEAKQQAVEEIAVWWMPSAETSERGIRRTLSQTDREAIPQTPDTVDQRQAEHLVVWYRADDWLGELSG